MLSFLMNFIPNSVFHILVLLGIFGVIGAFILPLGTYKIIIQAAAIVVLSAALFFEGALSNEESWAIKVAEAEKHVAELSAESAKANSELSDRISEIDLLEQEAKYATRTKIVHVRNIINKDCKISPDVIKIHNDSIKGTVK